MLLVGTKLALRDDPATNDKLRERYVRSGRPSNIRMDFANERIQTYGPDHLPAGTPDAERHPCREIHRMFGSDPKEFEVSLRRGDPRSL